jgi:preprotein translocase SecE subunit
MNKVLIFIQESKTELLSEVTWPTTKELFNSAMITIVSAIIMSVIIFVIDEVFGHLLIGEYYRLF